MGNLIWEGILIYFYLTFDSINHEIELTNIEVNRLFVLQRWISMGSLKVFDTIILLHSFEMGTPRIRLNDRK